TFNDGVLRVANTSASTVWQWAVPHEKYFFAYYDGSIHMTDDTGHVTTFEILDVSQDATYTYVKTDLGTFLPMPTFVGGLPANQYIAYPATTITQTNSGPADASIWASDLLPPGITSVIQGTSGNDSFSFESEAALAATAVFGNGGIDTIVMTAAVTLIDV